MAKMNFEHIGLKNVTYRFVYLCLQIILQIQGSEKLSKLDCLLL